MKYLGRTKSQRKEVEEMSPGVEGPDDLLFNGCGVPVWDDKKTFWKWIVEMVVQQRGCT